MAYPATFEVATTDALTGLLTAPYYRHLLREQAIPQARASGDPLALLMLDIDDFAGVNDRAGSGAGDAVLKGVGDLLRSTLPEHALLARYSGDEFAAAMPDTRLDDAFTLAEELRRRVAAFAVPDQPELRITCSIGLAAYPASGASDVEVVRAADQALYVAKTTGRNKVALPLTDSRMVTKTSHYTQVQLDRLAQLARSLGRNEASLLREALDDLLKKYNDRLGGPPTT